ncbi:MASE3 domain-containing protein [Thermodesulfobacteriota bacterium]
MTFKNVAANKSLTNISWVIVLIGLYFTNLYSYLLFHSLSEIFSVIVACAIFMVAWNSRRFLDNNYLMFLGMAYLFIGGLDLLHTLSYKGMGVFQGYGADLPTQLWIGARYVESISLLIAPLFLNRKVEIRYVATCYSIITVLLLISIFGDIFPECFIEDEGLTLFKKISEYLIALILIGSIILLFKNRKEFDERIFQFLVMSIILTVCGELAFTFYINVYGFSNLVGHYFKIASFYLIYKAIIETGLVKPYSLLFRNLKKSEEAFRDERNKLKDALEQVKMLSGLLPICAHCKKIRDDKGYWKQIESYIHDHSEAEFSHGICPDCMRKYYSDEKE